MKNKLNFIEYRLKLYGAVMAVVLLGMCVLVMMTEWGALWVKVIFALLAVLGAGATYIFYYAVCKPYQEYKKVENLFANGAVYNGIFELPNYLSEEDRAVVTRFAGLLDTQKLLNVSKKEAEYLALQNQINPHFLYNTLDGIRSEALMAGVDSIAEMTEALSTFFRYTISQTGNLVTLENELANIENYYYIQQFRFGDKLALSIEYDTDEDMDEAHILNLKLPKLTLQPIVENAIYHGIESKIGKGTLKIRITATSTHLIIKVSDDGTGIPEDQLSLLNESLKSLVIEEKPGKRGGIAIRNVNNRIKLLFGESYGVYIYSKEGVGTDVEITLPVVTGAEGRENEGRDYQV